MAKQQSLSAKAQAADEAVGLVENDTLNKGIPEPKIYKLMMRGTSGSQQRQKEGSYRVVKDFNMHHTSTIREYSDKYGRVVERQIRYVPGESSIYVDEQSEGAAQRAKFIHFEWGTIQVSPEDTNLALFMEKTGKNLNSKHRLPMQQAMFYELNPHMETAKKNVSNVSVSKVINWLDDTYHTEAGNAALKMYATTLGITTNAKEHFILNALIRQAQSDPKGFVEGFSSTANARKYYLMTAEKHGIIKVDRKEGTIRYKGNVVATADLGEDPINYMVRFATDANGAKIYDAIKQNVNAQKAHDFVMAGQEEMEAVLADVKNVIEQLTEIEKREYA